MASRLIRIAAIYLVVGACLGMYMGITQNFSLKPVHAHLLVAGWLSLAMTGVIYRLYPQASETRLAKAHFWLHNVGLPMFMVGLGAMLTGHDVPLALPAGSVALLLGLTCFCLNALMRIRG